MSEVLRLTNFKPEKVAPNFKTYLEKAGDVSFSEEIEEASRYGFITEFKPIKGIAKEVLLNGEPIGQIECYINPPGVAFQGELPVELAKPMRRSKSEKNDPPARTTKVSITYHWDHPLAAKLGRTDGWKDIPFP